MSRVAMCLAVLGLWLLGGAAMAAEPVDWGLGLQPAATPTAEKIAALHDLLLWIISGISLFVLALLIYVIVRYRASRNPTPSKVTHHTWLEIAWTGIPILILVVIGYPSIKLLYFADKTVEADMTLKATGHQWYWSYEYPDHGNFRFDAYLAAADAKQAEELGVKRLLDTDNRVVVPAGQKIRLLVTASDVLHNWAISAFGVRLDAVPGRLNETWFQVDKPGVYYGFCSELCGTGHAYMPIAVEALAPAEFEKWVAEAQAKFASDTAPAAAQREIAARAENETTDGAPR